MNKEGFRWGVKHVKSDQLHGAFVIFMDAEKWRDAQNPGHYKVVPL